MEPTVHALPVSRVVVAAMRFSDTEGLVPAVQLHVDSAVLPISDDLAMLAVSCQRNAEDAVTLLLREPNRATSWRVLIPAAVLALTVTGRDGHMKARLVLVDENAERALPPRWVNVPAGVVRSVVAGFALPRETRPVVCDPVTLSGSVVVSSWERVTAAMLWLPAAMVLLRASGAQHLLEQTASAIGRADHPASTFGAALTSERVLAAASMALRRARAATPESSANDLVAAVALLTKTPPTDGPAENALFMVAAGARLSDVTARYGLRDVLGAVAAALAGYAYVAGVSEFRTQDRNMVGLLAEWLSPPGVPVDWDATAAVSRLTEFDTAVMAALLTEPATVAMPGVPRSRLELWLRLLSEEWLRLRRAGWTSERFAARAREWEMQVAPRAQLLDLVGLLWPGPDQGGGSGRSAAAVTQWVHDLDWAPSELAEAAVWAALLTAEVIGEVDGLSPEHPRWTEYRKDYLSRFAHRFGRFSGAVGAPGQP